MIVISANMDISFLTGCLLIYFFIRFLANIGSTFVNDNSQLSKLFLIIAQLFGLLAGLMMTYAAKHYYIADKKIKDNFDDPQTDSF